jgi:EAL domain-containing protein (putative c-di-GMP-specific phosphodiesterase class I)
VRFQPLFRLSDRACVAAEALVRWDHPELGALSPEEFIPVAEQAGLIASLGDFVLRTVVDRAAQWRRLRPDFSVSVNVSPRQFRDSAIAESVRRELARAGLTGDALEVEVTEGLLLPERGEIERALGSLRAQGVGLVMDDFGTGYASLRYLRDHPFTSLKIDRGFIRDLDSQPRNRQLVVSALRLGQALGMKVVAEGVETEAELAVLAEAGCELVQGFLFSRPVDADRIAALLADGNAGE